MKRFLAGLIHHSDQGSQYTSIAFGNRCKEMDVRSSNQCNDTSLCGYWCAQLTKYLNMQNLPIFYIK